MRCKQCLTLDRVPGSDFDENGVCVWCRTGYPQYHPKGVNLLEQRLRQGLRPGSQVDCVVGVSGGKDSAFALWAIKRHFGLRAEAFTYDHSGVTPQARKNVRSVCDTLEVPLTVCSLKGDEHRECFVEFLEAFAERPNTVSAGLTCVACKHLHLFGTALAAKRRAPFVVWAQCPLEIPPFLALKAARENSTAREGLLKGSFLLASELLQSPRLMKAAVHHFSTTAVGCLTFSPNSAYLKLRYPSVEQIPFFEYWPWNPEAIYKTLADAGWQKPATVPSDWHSDCAYHPLKEYMFQQMFGVSYTDGFLSNLIRAGLITREEALQQLAVSKEHFAKEVPYSIHQLGLDHLADKIDADCFRVCELT